MLIASGRGEFQMSTSAYVTIMGCIVYVASPLDAIPDTIPIVGWYDDT